VKAAQKYLSQLRQTSKIPSIVGPRFLDDRTRRYIYQVRPSGNLFFPDDVIIGDVILNIAIKIKRTHFKEETRSGYNWTTQVWFPDGGTEVSENISTLPVAWHWGEIRLAERGVVLVSEPLFPPIDQT